MDEVKLREAFSKIKLDMDILRVEMLSLKREIEEIKEILKRTSNPLSSTGNEGVPTNQQTNRQTDNTPAHVIDDISMMTFNTPAHNPADNPADVQQIKPEIQHIDTEIQPKIEDKGERVIERLAEISSKKSITDMVNNLKIDLKRKFQALTKQEFMIFSVLFTVENEQKQATYKDIALKTGLTESSIRDYIQRITNKGIPIIKEKLNNKVVILRISEDLKNIATLENLMKLRGAGIGEF